MPRVTIEREPWARPPRPPVVPRVLEPLGGDPDDLAALVDDGDRAAGLLCDARALTGLDLDLAGHGRFELTDCRVQGGSIVAGARTEVVLRDCELIDVDLSGLTGIVSVRRVALRGCRLVGTSFANGELDDVSFDDCVLRYTDLRMAVLRRVAIRGSRLDEVDLYEAQVEDLDLTGSRLVQVSLDRASCERVDLRGALELGLTDARQLRGCLVTAAQVIEHAEAIALAAGVLLAQRPDDA